MKLTDKELKLMRLALDRAASQAEAENAWVKLLNSLRSRSISGCDLEDLMKTVSRENIIAAYMSEIARRPRNVDPQIASERARKAAAKRWKKKSRRKA